MSIKKKILIVDDDIDLVEAMKITLESSGYAVITAFEPEDGFNKAKAEKPDLIILDVMFGREGKSQGFDYPFRMRRDKGLKPIPILMSTSVNMEYPNLHFGEDNSGEYLPVDDFVDKPIEPEDLLLRVKKLLEAGESVWANWPEKKSS